MAGNRHTGRLACVNLPAFPLQLQLLEQPQWRRYPCAVIDCDKPQGTLLWVNEEARRRRVLPGMRYAAALALARDLRAAEVPAARIEQAAHTLVSEVLTGFSPRVEASETEPGVFWLDLAGMERLFPDLEDWAARLSRRLSEEGFISRVVVGWSRFHTYALAKALPPTQWSVVSGQWSVVSCRLSDPTHPDVAKTASENVGAGLAPARSTPADTSRGDLGEQGWTTGGVSASALHDVPRAHSPGAQRSRGEHPPSKPEWCEPFPGGQALRAQVLLCHSPDHERQLAYLVPLARIGLDPAVRDALDDLGIHDLGGFADLPHEGIERRFGPQAAHLHQQACGRRQPPLVAEEVEVEICERMFLEDSVRDLPRLMVWVESLLDSCLASLTKRGEMANMLTLELLMEDRSIRRESLRSAEPTSDRQQWLELLGLRLDSVRIAAGAQEIALTLAGRRVAPGQMDLFAIEPRRDLAAANRALARIRAELGDTAVRKAEVRDGHLPEARFAWRPFETLSEAIPSRIAEARLIRRFFTRPRKLPPRPRQEPDGWLLRGLTDSPVDKVRGPFIIAGGWWRKPVQREYHYAETRTGEVLWTYYDRQRRCWFLQGRLE